ncbi:MAG: site-specific DNA-methyltransferase, partial [Kiritimatiellaeota bacterium]|nr:site-specific DNA-methyltransferase [Kiritimatiellota bacterium]
MDGQSLDTRQRDVEALRKLFPNIFSEGKVDLEKVRAAFCDEPYFNNERYTLNWAGKTDAFKSLQERTSATLKPQPELSVNFDATENVFVEGENLEVLKVLQKSYYGKVKCIVIDPPYNTGNDSFIYPDRFKENLVDYERRVGDKDEEGCLMKEG